MYRYSGKERRIFSMQGKGPKEKTVRLIAGGKVGAVQLIEKCLKKKKKKKQTGYRWISFKQVFQNPISCHHALKTSAL